MDITSPAMSKNSRIYAEAIKQNPDNPDLLYSAGMTFLAAGMYDRSLETLDRCISLDPFNNDALFLESIAALGGKRPFACDRRKVDKAIECINAAISLEDRGIYRFMSAFLRYDYYSRKFLRINPDYKSELETATMLGVSELEISDLFKLLKTERLGF